MSHVQAVCMPATDQGFAERVQRVVAANRWNPDGPKALAALETSIRRTDPMAGVVIHDGMSVGGIRRTVVLHAFRDGAPTARDARLAGVRALYESSAARVYGIAVATLGRGREAEVVVEQSFAELRRASSPDGGIADAEAELTASATRLTNEAKAARPPAPVPTRTGASTESTFITDTAQQISPRHRSLRADTLARLPSIQRDALELAMLERLKVGAIADRMQTTTAAVHRLLRDALLAAGSGSSPTAASTLRQWRHAESQWERRQADARDDSAAATEVAHAWLDHQIASANVSADTTVVITDKGRRIVAATANAGATFGRPSIIGLRVEDVTAPYARAMVPTLWTMFEAGGAMEGEYDCERPGQEPVRLPFRGVWGCPLPTLQVGYLQHPPLPAGR